jgi:hypothetical protein
MTTNPAQGLSRWTPIATNAVGNNGDFSITVTNAVNRNAPGRYYILQMH